VSVALAPVLALMVAGIAQATTGPAPALPSCPSSTLCAFQNSGYGGTRWQFAYSSHVHDTWFWIGSGANDQVSSYYNHRAFTSWFDKACPANQDNWFVPGGEALSNLAGINYISDNTPVNDSFSAVALMSSASSSNVLPVHGSC
jgi:hypothetical protein